MEGSGFRIKVDLFERIHSHPPDIHQKYTATHLIFCICPLLLTSLSPLLVWDKNPWGLMGNACLYSEWRNLLPRSLHICSEYSDISTHTVCLHCTQIVSWIHMHAVFLFLSFGSKVLLHVFLSIVGYRSQTCVIQHCICYSISFLEFPFWLNLSPNFGSSPKRRPISLFHAH